MKERAQFCEKDVNAVKARPGLSYLTEGVPDAPLPLMEVHAAHVILLWASLPFGSTYLTNLPLTAFRFWDEFLCPYSSLSL